MTKKFFFCFVPFVLVAFLIATTSVYSQDWFCERNCKAFEQDGKCICYEFNPSLPYEEVEKEEYNNKKSASAVLYGLNGDIWLDGKKMEWNFVNFSKVNNFDFALLHGYFWTGDDENIEKTIRNCSFYASSLRYSQFSNTFFINCDFRYASLIGTDFSGISDSCKFYGAKIKGAKLFLSQEQLLSTDPFIEKISGTNNIKKQIYLEKVTLKSKGYQPPIFSYPEDLKKLNVPIEYDKLPRDDSCSHNIDFNKFRNGNQAELPYVIRDCKFLKSFIDCNFARGTIEDSRFESDLFLNRKVEKCDFSNAKLKNVDFSFVSLKSSRFDEAEIQGVNFAGKINFYDPATHDKNGELLPQKPQAAANYLIEYYVNREKIFTTHMIVHGLQKNQLQKTASFKKRKLIDCKFCMDMGNLDFTGFNLRGCQFAGDLTNAIFHNADITDCFFAWKSNITVEQIKSTLNYQNNRMDGIKLPKEIQKILDAEKQTPTNATAK
jgi:uncharacterized protein YjbI with pentapeptide repeats